MAAQTLHFLQSFEEQFYVPCCPSSPWNCDPAVRTYSIRTAGSPGFKIQWPWHATYLSRYTYHIFSLLHHAASHRLSSYDTHIHSPHIHILMFPNICISKKLITLTGAFLVENYNWRQSFQYTSSFSFKLCAIINSIFNRDNQLENGYVLLWLKIPEATVCTILRVTKLRQAHPHPST
jgi:hypothetical protein